MMRLLVLTGFLCFGGACLHAEMFTLFLEHNAAVRTRERSIAVQRSDTLRFFHTGDAAAACVWAIIKPVRGSYDNLRKGAGAYRAALRYTIHPFLYDVAAFTWSNYADSCGTFYVACFHPGDSLLKRGAITDRRPLHKAYPQQLIQVSVRRDNSYLGYLTELLNTPFILPPKTLRGYGHQTDLRMGTDCAELAIYGKRRQGHSIPYTGPRHIYPYLRAIPRDSLFAGCILHFGEQVVVLYRDRGRTGFLDKDDLLIQAWHNGVEILSVADFAFKDEPYRPFAWKSDYAD